MSYYLRYFVDDQRATTLAQLRADLQRAGVALQLSIEGELSMGEELLAQVEVNAKGSDLFEDELNRFLGAVESTGAAGSRVARRLRETRAVVAVQVLWQQTSTNADPLTPFWSWLVTYRSGLLQADGHGFYDGGQLILQLA